MTVLCITAEHLPGIRPCTHLGQHRINCPDREVNRAIAAHVAGEANVPDIACRGCLPRKAERGFLCQGCWERLDEAMLRWPQFRRLVVETDGRAVSPEGGGKGSTPDGYTNLPLTFLALDECDRLRRSGLGVTLEAWVHTEAGARDAIMFAHAAQRAYQSLEVEKRELKLERVRCPHCDRLSLTANPHRQAGGATIVECQHCGELLDKIRDESSRWTGSESCEDGDMLAHRACTDLACRCDCHSLGRTSTAQGIQAVWDADQHATGYVDRRGWRTDGASIWRAGVERKTA